MSDDAIAELRKSFGIDVKTLAKYYPLGEVGLRAFDNNLSTIQAEIQKQVTLGKIEILNQIRHSDVKLNHGTIELMGYMSQQLNKELQATLNREKKVE